MQQHNHPGKSNEITVNKIRVSSSLKLHPISVAQIVNEVLQNEYPDGHSLPSLPDNNKKARELMTQLKECYYSTIL